MRHILFRMLLLPGCLVAVLALSLSPAWAQPRHYDKSLETMYASVSYHDAQSLLDFGRRIGTGEAALVRDDDRAKEMVKEDIDRLVFRVKSLLDMHPPHFRFNIIILSTYGEIKKAYRDLGIEGTVPIAFYRQKSHTIYVSLDKLSAGVFAHEVAHAVINAFFSTPPPAQMQEILAQYVDKHLKD